MRCTSKETILQRELILGRVKSVTETVSFHTSHFTDNHYHVITHTKLSDAVEVVTAHGESKPLPHIGRVWRILSLSLLIENDPIFQRVPLDTLLSEAYKSIFLLENSIELYEILVCNAVYLEEELCTLCQLQCFSDGEFNDA